MFFYFVNSLFAFSFMINLQGAHNFLKMQNGTVRSIFDVFGVCHLAIQRGNYLSVKDPKLCYGTYLHVINIFNRCYRISEIL